MRLFREGLVAPEYALMINQFDVIIHDLKSCLSLELFPVGCDPTECVTHNRNQHVEEDDNAQEGRHVEERVEQKDVVAIGNTIVVEFSQPQLEHVLERADDPDAVDVLDQFALIML